MAYTAQKTPYGTYEIFLNGNKIATGTESTLGTYGLSASNLGGSSPTPSYTPPYSTGGTITPTTSSSFLSSSQFAELQALEAQRAAELEAARKRKAQLDAYITQVSTMIKAGEGTKLTQFFNTIPNEFRTEVTSATNYSPSGPVRPAPGTVYSLNGQQVYDSYNPYTNQTITRNANTGEVISNTVASSSGISPTDTSSGTGTSSGNIPWLDPSVSNLSIMNYGPNEWQGVVKSLKPGTPEFQAAMDEIDTSFYYNLIQMVNAQTDQEKAAADYNWDVLRESIKTNLGITLSKNAIDAWGQLQGLKTQYGAQNIGGSGLEAESIDTYLRKVRASDSVERLNAKNKTEAGQMAYMRGFASSKQIEDFAKTNPELARSWGLIPSTEALSSFNVDTLKQKFPNMSDEDIQKNINSMFFKGSDGNYYYRSSLYQKQLYGNSLGANPGTESYTLDDEGNRVDIAVQPSDWGIEDINKAMEQFQKGKVFINLANQQEAAENAPALGNGTGTGASSGSASGSTGSTGSTPISSNLSGTQAPITLPYSSGGTITPIQTPITPPVNPSNTQTSSTLPYSTGGTITPTQAQQIQTAAQNLGGSTPSNSSANAPIPTNPITSTIPTTPKYNYNFDVNEYLWKPGETTETYNARIKKLRGF